MKLELDIDRGFSRLTPDRAVFSDRAEYRVEGETARLARVLLCAPDYLAPVPCCSVTRESIRDGFVADSRLAARQHRELHAILAAQGVAVEVLPAAPDLADSCFTRDVGVSTPWGLVALNPALEHRAPEVANFAAWARRRTGRAVEQVTAGHIEGGDICIVRPGLLIVGVSGHRTDRAGAEAFAARFHADGWDVLLYEFDEHFLHLDTIFSMLRPDLALGCSEVLDDGFIAALAGRGITLLPVTYKEARRLGANVVSLDGGTIIASDSTPRVSAMMRAAGLTVIETDISQFAACGGGVHCLTMPLLRGR